MGSKPRLATVESSVRGFYEQVKELIIGLRHQSPLIDWFGLSGFNRRPEIREAVKRCPDFLGWLEVNLPGEVREGFGVQRVAEEVVVAACRRRVDGLYSSWPDLAKHVALLCDGRVSSMTLTGVQGAVTDSPIQLGAVKFMTPPNPGLCDVGPRHRGTPIFLSSSFLVSFEEVLFSELANEDPFECSLDEALHQRLAKALRLSLGERLRISGTLRTVGFFGRCGGGQFSSRAGDQLSPVPDCLLVGEESRKEILEIERRLAMQAPKVRLAQQRFDDACRRDNSVDRLVDLAIALESLLVQGGGGGGIIYKMSLRGARMLAEPGERARKQKQLKNFYDLRSATVHGRSSKPKGGGSGVIDCTADDARQLLRFFTLGSSEVGPELGVFEDALLLGDLEAHRIFEKVRSRWPKQTVELIPGDEVWKRFQPPFNTEYEVIDDVW